MVKRIGIKTRVCICASCCVWIYANKNSYKWLYGKHFLKSKFAETQKNRYSSRLSAPGDPIIKSSSEARMRRLSEYLFLHIILSIWLVQARANRC
jgi:hypothetical protein